MPSSYAPNLAEDDDYWTVIAMETYGGSFVHALASAARAADPKNLAALKGAFPGIWQEYRGMGDELKRRAGGRRRPPVELA